MLTQCSPTLGLTALWLSEGGIINQLSSLYRSLRQLSLYMFASALPQRYEGNALLQDSRHWQALYTIVASKWRPPFFIIMNLNVLLMLTVLYFNTQKPHHAETADYPVRRCHAGKNNGILSLSLKWLFISAEVVRNCRHRYTLGDSAPRRSMIKHRCQNYEHTLPRVQEWQRYKQNNTGMTGYGKGRGYKPVRGKEETCPFACKWHGLLAKGRMPWMGSANSSTLGTQLKRSGKWVQHIPCTYKVKLS